MKPKKDKIPLISQVVLFLAAITFLPSCSSVNLSERNAIDKKLTSKNFQVLEGTFSNFQDSSGYPSAPLNLFESFRGIANSSDKKNEYSIVVNPINKKQLQLFLFHKDYMVDDIILDGKYRRGYFKVKTKRKADFILGPLIWSLADRNTFIGLTYDDGLIVLNSSGGAMFLIAFPLFAADGGKSAIKYKRLE